jgi:integrase
MLLTDRFCAGAKPLNGLRTEYHDSTVPGLALRVSEHGKRSWCFHFRSPRNGKRARATIGSYPSTSLAAARGRALEAREQIEAGNDPRLIMACQASAAMTVSALVDAYLADPEKLALRSRAEIERRLRRNVLPVIGDIKLAELRRRDIRNCTDALLKRGVKVEATRVFEDIRGVLRWAVQNEYLDSSPTEVMPKPAAPTSRSRVLSDDEIKQLWNGLPKTLAKSVQCQHIIKLCLVTGQRVGEVAGITRSEVDLKAREWRLPGERTKNGFSHVVPLSDLAIHLIKEAMANAGEGEPIFPCGEGSLSPVAVARTILRANTTGRFGIASWSAHDLRRSALTAMARLGVAPIVLGHVANHRTTTRAGVTLSVYSHYAYDKEKRAAIDLWAGRLQGIVGEGGAAGAEEASAPKAEQGDASFPGLSGPKIDAKIDERGILIIRATDHKHGIRSTQPDARHNTKARIVFAQEEIIRRFPRGLPEKRPRNLTKDVRARLAQNSEWLFQGYEPISRRTVNRAWRELQKP